MQHHRSLSKSGTSGFTLIELSIVLVIIGFFMVGLIKAYELYLVEQKQQEMDNKMDEMRRALADYIQDKKCELPTDHPDHPNQDGNPANDVAGPVPGSDTECANDPDTIHLANEGVTGSAGNGQDAVRYPCPADPSLPPTSADYATEVNNSGGTCDTSGGVISIASGDAYRGAFPAKTVGLPPEAMIDPYGNKFSYVVSGDMVQNGALSTSPSDGNLQISDGSGGTPRDAQFALFSHGPNGAGAWTRQGEDLDPPDSTVAEHGNVDDNLEFETRQGQFRADTNQYYDDTFAASLVDDKDDEWWFSDDGGRTIEHRNPGDVIMGDKAGSNVGIGTNSPETQLHVDGSGKIGDDQNIGTANSSTEGMIQQGSNSAGMGYLEVPWIYTNGCIEGDNRGMGATSICLGGDSGTTYNPYSEDDEIAMQTRGRTIFYLDDDSGPSATGRAQLGFGPQVHGQTFNGGRPFVHFYHPNRGGTLALHTEGSEAAGIFSGALGSNGTYSGLYLGAEGGSSHSWAFKHKGNPAGDLWIQEGDITGGDTHIAVEDGTGNVGIGTTSPAQKLHIFEDDTNATSLRVENASSSGQGYVRMMGTGDSMDTYSALYLDDDNAGNAGNRPWVWAHKSSPNSDLWLQKGPGGIVPFAVSSSNGNIGIGTTSPSFDLDVEGNTQSGHFFYSDVPSPNNVNAGGGGTDLSSVGTCPSGMYLAGFDGNGNKVCRNLPSGGGNNGGNLNVSCPSGKVLTGIQNGSAQCVNANSGRIADVCLAGNSPCSGGGPWCLVESFNAFNTAGPSGGSLTTYTLYVKPASGSCSSI
jgi:prepilin-type N-terminal cleavage/methylation domain-containing protein